MDADFVRSILRLDATCGKLYWIAPSKYHAEKTGLEAGTPTPSRGGKVYVNVTINGRKYKRSRLVFLMTRGHWPHPCVDHINGDSTDDRPENLRQATVTENAWNHKRRSRRINLPMGVRIFHSSGRFQARISHEKKQIHLGCYDTAEEAHSVYLTKRKELFREFA